MQAVGVVFTASFLGLSGLAGLIVNYCAPPSASFDIKTEDQTSHVLQHSDLADPQFSRSLR